LSPPSRPHLRLIFAHLVLASVSSEKLPLPGNLSPELWPSSPERSAPWTSPSVFLPAVFSRARPPHELGEAPAPLFAPLPSRSWPAYLAQRRCDRHYRRRPPLLYLGGPFSTSIGAGQPVVHAGAVGFVGEITIGELGHRRADVCRLPCSVSMTWGSRMSVAEPRRAGLGCAVLGHGCAHSSGPVRFQRAGPVEF